MTNEKNLNCFPKNLEKFFKNLDSIHFNEVDFSSLKKSDLQPLGSQLKAFFFYDNKLKVIPADLFEYARNLEYINIKSNQIRGVEKGTFDQLHQLTELNFNNNPCYSGAAANRADVLTLVKQIESKCTDME